jgi:two-component system NarL family response regulator
MLTAFSESERVFSALKAGAVGYLLKNVSPDEIRTTVERVAAGDPMLSGEIAGRVLREFEREREEERYREQLAGLTAREEEILRLLATGESNREIGKRLFISELTVKNHVANIFRKLQVNDRTKAALLAVKLGLGEPTSR